MKRLLSTRLALILLATLVALVVAELALPSIGFPSDSVAVIPDPYLHHVHLKDRTFVAHHPSGEFGGFELRFDSDGRISGTPPPAGTTCRIALMGDSFMEAAQVPYEQSMAGRLAAFGKPLAGRAACEVRNYGVRAYGPAVYLVQYTRDIRPWKPTAVAVLLYANDMADDEEYLAGAETDANGFPVAIRGPGNGWLETRLRRSSVVRLTRTAARQVAWMWSNDRGERRVASGFIEDYPELSDPTARLLIELNRRIRADGATALFMAVPSSYKLHGGDMAGKVDFHSRAKSFAEANGLRFLDLYSPFERATSAGSSLFFQHDVHFNAAGHAVVASELHRIMPMNPKNTKLTKNAF